MSPPARRGWLAYFAVLGVLGLAALVIPILYNLGLQLTPEQEARARALWRSAAPADYDLTMGLLTTRGGEETRDEYRVAVRGGRTVLVGLNGWLLHADPSLAVPAGTALLGMPPEDLHRFGVNALFADIEAALKHDAASGGRDYLTVTFDPRDGHPIRYVHRIRGTREQVEWMLRLTRVGEH
jgi:hypothetical protein